MLQCSDNRENPSTFNGIKFSISALGPYFADSSQPKIKAVHVLEILPNGDKAFCGKKTMSELLHFVYQNEISEPADADSSVQPRQQGYVEYSKSCTLPVLIFYNLLSDKVS